MLGALLGDIVGSKYEFNNIRTKGFPLFGEGCFMTDDSIMTLAVCEILKNNYQYDKDKIIQTFKKWGRAYPNRGYGCRFANWLFGDDTKSYNSLGNGAAMRISPVGWYARNEKEVREFSKTITEVTHSHPEGLKAAEVVAMCVYYARIGKTKEFIKEYVEQYYSLDFDYEDLRRNYRFTELSQDTVPQAIYCFLISNNLEDCIRTTISIGGDCDTTAAISCAIADAYYKDMDQELVSKIKTYLPKPIGGCVPITTLIDFEVDKAASNCLCEEITPLTKFVAEINKFNDRTEVTWSFSKSYKALAQSLISSTLTNLYEFDLYDFLNDTATSAEEVDDYIEEVIYASDFSNEFQERLRKLKVSIKKFFDCDDEQHFKEFLNIYNKEMESHYDGLEYRFFNSNEEAWQYLKDNFNIAELYQDAFLSTYKKFDLK